MTQTAEIKTSVNREKAEDGTVYWTLSLYVEPEAAAKVLGLKKRIPTEDFRVLQTAHMPSRALRDAINPLMNDIADREVIGQVNDFLLAADEQAEGDPTGDRTARGFIDLRFELPESLSWQTEGRRFTACPPGLNAPRDMRLRRFWMAHNNGALSYHLSFTHYYGSEGGHNPATYYFLSVLQKLAAPKEYHLAGGGVGSSKSVFEDQLDIAPLDGLKVHFGGKPMRFWSFVDEQFELDAQSLFSRLAAQNQTQIQLEGRYKDHLLELVPFVEVPGLYVPRSRFMFFVHDKRFFKRLMPEDPVTKELLPRRKMVKSACYDDYRDKVGDCENTDDQDCRAVDLGTSYWDWVLNRPDWARRLQSGWLVVDEADGTQRVLTDPDEAQRALREGTCRLNRANDSTPLNPAQPLHIRGFDWSRSDCLDYLFLAGFNQNIIDFMNQDTSEVLDATDPIYPSKDAQADERFFVRYANHRAMITYVKSSRSLEFGNDYIGTCPYAFLIHVLALHNEFLARAHERASLAGIDEIRRLIDNKLFDKAEDEINRLKLREFDDFEQYRYENPFRYDTERDVFTDLEMLRGVSRKQQAIVLAVSSLEDTAADLQRHAQTLRDRRLNILLGGLGIFGAGQMIYWIGEKALSDKEDHIPRGLLLIFKGDAAVGHIVMGLTEIFIALSSLALVAYLGLEFFAYLKARKRARQYETVAKRERGGGL